MEPVKNTFNEVFFEKLTETIAKNDSSFSKNLFLSKVWMDEWEGYELKERMHHVTKCLYETLPQEYESAIQILMSVAPDITFKFGFASMIFPNYVEMYGLDHWDISIKALEEFTKYSSSEFAVRPFIMKNKEQMMKTMTKWAKHENFHVRRLASEGCRPRLPWAMALPDFKKDPTLILPILKLLKDDPEEYVRRSVANNLNDISKDHSKLVLEITKRWLGKSKETDWVVKHALRTLLKAGDTGALLMFGFSDPKNIEVVGFQIHTKNIKIGDSLSFSFQLQKNKESEEKIRIEYAIYFMKSNGELTKKVFKISERVLTSNIEVINRNHSFKLITTRKYYPGMHKVAIIINGVKKSVGEFELVSE
ncbi:DNA alkylation repair protein [Chengkuizengella axinellae]|uniref:DNA alkylation repair protein n=1 Tax=Chengkuizengella axinellae TaxID=3064388 RepID=A0ABT9ITN5_9BACL|nr:DNA alkylation repair protein [Chengkuizengella sp. 2205SS18-9]MDP5272704.1 DNA alkylation repair protein [Chengkuizengella sp. 2205SS18-9]